MFETSWWHEEVLEVLRKILKEEKLMAQSITDLAASEAQLKTAVLQLVALANSQAASLAALVTNAQLSPADAATVAQMQADAKATLDTVQAAITPDTPPAPSPAPAPTP